MQKYERSPGEGSIIHYRHALSWILPGLEHCPRLSHDDNRKFGEAIITLRTALGQFGDVDAMDADPKTIPSQARTLFHQYRDQVSRLAEGNLRLIWTAFRASPTLWNLPDDDLQDLAGTAQEELLRSAAHYDPWYSPHEEDAQDTPRIPRKFSTYAVKNMHFVMLRAAKEFHYLHVPNQRWEQYNAYWDARSWYADQQKDAGYDALVVTAEFKRTEKRFPTPEELLSYTKRIKSDKLIRAYAKILMIMDTADIEELVIGNTVDRDDSAEVWEEKPDSIEDIIPSPDDVPETVSADIARETITRIFDRIWPGVLSGNKIIYPRERQVLTLQYLEEKQWSVEEISHKFHMTEKRVNQIKAIALRKLRHPTYRSQLADFLFTAG